MAADELKISRGQPLSSRCAANSRLLVTFAWCYPDRVGHRVRNHDQGRAVDHRADTGMLGEDAVDQRPVGDVALVEGAARRELAPAGHQAVQDHRADPRVGAGRRDRAADITGAASDQDLHPFPHLRGRQSSTNGA